jgi:hypothetical protein
VSRLRSGRFDEARSLQESIAVDAKPHPALPVDTDIEEVLFWLGACQTVLSDEVTAGETWRRLTREFPESRWAWRAAAHLADPPSAEGLAFRLRRPDDAVLEFLATPPREPLASSEIARGVQSVTSFLLRHQREDGSWRSTPAEMGAAAYRTDVLTAAVTAICGRALLMLPGDDARAAARRALSYVAQWSLAQGQERDTTLLLDYGPWGYAYALRFVGMCAEAKLETSHDLDRARASLISALKLSQMEGGGWNYRVFTSVNGDTTSTNQSASFMTATVALALMEAARHGDPVPGEMIDAALDCLEQMRGPEDRFEYFLSHGQAAQHFATAAGSAGRGPVCTLALYKGGRATVDDLRESLETFATHLPSYARERGKSLMHAAPDGQGSHYLLFDYSWSATTLAELPASERDVYRKPLIDCVLQARLSGGSFLDNAINGRHYGAGMALEALQALADAAP